MLHWYRIGSAFADCSTRATCHSLTGDAAPKTHSYWPMCHSSWIGGRYTNTEAEIHIVQIPFEVHWQNSTGRWTDLGGRDTLAVRLRHFNNAVPFLRIALLLSAGRMAAFPVQLLILTSWTGRCETESFWGQCFQRRTQPTTVSRPSRQIKL